MKGDNTIKETGYGTLETRKCRLINHSTVLNFSPKCDIICENGKKFTLIKVIFF